MTRMQLLGRKKNSLKIKITSAEDLWYLTMIVEAGDKLTGKAYRKVNLSSKDEKANIAKKTIAATITIEKYQYEPESRLIRVNGSILNASDPEITLGSHQSITLEENSIFTLEKEHMHKYQEEKLKDALKEQEKILLVIHDREQAILALLQNVKYTILEKIQGNVAKKDKDTVTSNFYKEIAKELEEQAKRHNVASTILASPSFFKEYVLEHIDNKKHIVQATVGSVGENAIQEILKRDEIKQALSQQRIAQESKSVEELFASMQKGEPVAYGLKEVSSAVEAGAVKTLLIADTFLQEHREVDTLMKNVERSGEIMLISAEHEQGQRLHNLSGIAALLRFPIQ